MIFQNIQVSKTHEQRGREKCQLIPYLEKLSESDSESNEKKESINVSLNAFKR